MPTATAALAPVVKTDFAASFRTGRRECWAARTTDGAWAMTRLDITGTPWAVVHIPTGADMALKGSLRACREYIGSGRAAAELGMRLCVHPAALRSSRVDHGTWDWRYELCLGCGATRPVHDDDDRCSTCRAHDAGDGPGHDWFVR